jgi:hypothetical protein
MGLGISPELSGFGSRLLLVTPEFLVRVAGAGGGAEWRFLKNWSVKAEYLYVNFGHQSVNAVAGVVAVPGTALASYRASSVTLTITSRPPRPELQFLD